MTYQEPDDPRRRQDYYLDRSDPSVGWAPLLMGIAFLGVLALLFLASTWGPQSDRVTSQRTELPNTAPGAPPAPTPAPPRPQ